MNALFSPKALVVISWAMMLIGLTADTLVWFHLIAKTEPPLVLHLSTFALIFGGFGNIITAKINKEIKK